MATDSPFSGGGGTGTGTGGTPPADLMAMFQKMSIRKYIVDPLGANIEMTFFAQQGTVTLKTGTQTLTLPFVRIE